MFDSGEDKEKSTVLLALIKPKKMSKSTRSWSIKNNNYQL